MNILDKIVNYISPEQGAKRLAFRTAQQIASDYQYPAEPMAAYQGAFPTRISTPWGQSESMGGLTHLNQVVARNMRDRARSLCDNNPIASSILNRAVENIVGNGFQFQALTEDKEWNTKAEKQMLNWLPFADFGNRTWHQHQRLVVYSLLRDGDVGSALLSKGQVQLVEGDYISSPFTRPDAFLHDGIELDKFGRPSQFWVMTYIDQKNRTWKPVSKDNFVFVANMRRVTQYRGETSFAQSFDLFEQLDGYINAVVLAQKIAACLAVYITKIDPTNSVQGLGTTHNARGEQRREQKIEPGTVKYLNQGESIEQINPSQPGSGFDTNVRMLLRILGLSFGLPLENVLLDFSTVSGNTAKASAQAAQKTFEQIQKLVIESYLSRIYRWRIQKFIDDGELEDRPDKFKHRWHAEPWPFLDPVTELKAFMLEVDAGLTTERRHLLSLGIDPDQLQNERAAELDAKRAKNIPIYHSTFSAELGTMIKPSIEEADGTQTNVTGADVHNAVNEGSNGSN